jgi:glycerol-3-phosphate dehydrogenase
VLRWYRPLVTAGLKREPESLAVREHDLLVVGGGIYGAAIAWDAAQRGLTVALVEARDFGGQTSWSSARTIHGGFRYLQGLDLVRMRESIRERSALLRIAPAIVRPLPFLVPAYGHGRRGIEILSTGLKVADLVSFDRNRNLPVAQRIPGGQVLGPSAVLSVVPGVPEKGLTGGILWTDSQLTHHERLIVALLKAASGAGAQAANYLKVVGFLQSGSRITGARAVDDESGRTLEIPARFVVNAAGPEMDAILGLAGIERPPTPLLRAVNLVLKRPFVTGFALGLSSGRRNLFLVPFRGRSLLGTGYAPAEDDGGRLGREFFEEARRTFSFLGLGPDDVDFLQLGLVPGAGSTPANQTTVIDHEATDGVKGLLSVQGVKYTTARGVAEGVVDRVLRRLERRGPPSRTAVTPLEAAQPLCGTLEEQTRAVVEGEMALHLADVLLRRVDLGSFRRATAEEANAALAVMARALSWSGERVAHERSRWLSSYPALEFSQG